MELSGDEGSGQVFEGRRHDLIVYDMHFFSSLFCESLEIVDGVVE